MSGSIRWRQRFNSYLKALQTLAEAVELAEERDLSNLERQGIIQGFKVTHELAWKVLKDYLEEQGVGGIIGPKNAAREALKKGLIEDGEAWTDMVKARNLSPLTYNREVADAVVEDILTRFYPAFQQMSRQLSSLAQQAD